MSNLFFEDRERWVEENIDHLKNGRLNEIDRVNMIVALAEMAYGRNRSLAVLENLQDQICEHLLLVCLLPEAQERDHWLTELEAWRRKLSIINKNPKQKRPIYSVALLSRKFWEEPFSDEADIKHFFKLMNKDYLDLEIAINTELDVNKFKKFVMLFIQSIISDGDRTAEIFKKWRK